MWELIGTIIEALNIGLDDAIFDAILTKFPKLAALYKKAQTPKAKLMAIKKAVNGATPDSLIRALLRLPNKKIQSLIKSRKTAINNQKDIKKGFTDTINKYKTDRSNLYATNRLDKSIKNGYAKDELERYKSGANIRTGKGIYVNLDKNTNTTKWVALSSSWIKFGKYTSGDNAVGTMIIKIKSDHGKKWYGPYVYPDVNVNLWHAMVRAKGKNGSGAGTIFWRSYLHDWLGSRLRQISYEQLYNTTTDKDSKKYLEGKIRSISLSRQRLLNESPRVKFNRIDTNAWLKERSKKFKDIKRQLNQTINQKIISNREKIKDIRLCILGNTDMKKITIQKIKSNKERIAHLRAIEKGYNTAKKVTRNPAGYLETTPTRIKNKVIRNIKKYYGRNKKGK